MMKRPTLLIENDDGIYEENMDLLPKVVAGEGKDCGEEAERVVSVVVVASASLNDLHPSPIPKSLKNFNGDDRNVVIEYNNKLDR